MHGDACQVRAGGGVPRKQGGLSVQRCNAGAYACAQGPHVLYLEPSPVIPLLLLPKREFVVGLLAELLDTEGVVLVRCAWACALHGSYSNLPFLRPEHLAVACASTARPVSIHLYLA